MGEDKELLKKIDDCIKAILLDPNPAEAYLYRGALYEQLGQYEKAIDDYDKSIHLDPLIMLLKLKLIKTNGLHIDNFGNLKKKLMIIVRQSSWTLMMLKLM